MRILILIFYFLISSSIQQQSHESKSNLDRNDKISEFSAQQRQKFLSQSQVQAQADQIGDSKQQINYNDKDVKLLEDTNSSQQQNDQQQNQNQGTATKIEKEIEWSLLFLLGLFCSVLGITFEWKNEKYLIRFLKLLDYIRSSCKTQEFGEGDLIFISGKVNYSYNLADPLFNLNIEKAAKIFRKIEMVQYEEKNKKEEQVDQNGNLIISRTNSTRGTKSSDYIKKWISYRVPILNFKNQDKIQKSQKYCKFIAETDSFQMSRISLSIANASLLQINSPIMSPIHKNLNQNFSSMASNVEKEGGGITLKLHSSMKNIFQNTVSQSGSMTTPNLQYGMHHSNSLNNQHGGQKIYITDLSCFDEFPQQQFNYNQLTNNEKELITNKIEDLRRLQVTFQDWHFDTHVLFKDDQVIISRKQDFKMHLGDNKMQHYYIYADEISVLGKLGSKGTLIPFYSIQENNEDIELDEMDDINNSPLLRKRTKEIPFLNLKSQIYSTDSNIQNQTSGVSHSYGGDRIRNNGGESTFSYILCFLPRMMKNIFAFDDKVYWALDKVVKLEEFLDIKKNQFSKQVKICRYISFGLIFISMYLCIFPILNVFGLINVDNLEENQPFYIKLFIAILTTVTTMLGTIFPLYTVYKIHYGFILIPSILLLLYIINQLSS